MRYLVSDTHALVQQLSMRLLNHGYVFYSTAHVPEHKAAEAVDVKLLLRYGGWLSRWQRARRWRDEGQAKVQYLRCGRLVVVVATQGTSPFFQHEAFRDAREVPLCIGGYALSPGRVRIHRTAYNRLARYFEQVCCQRSQEWLERKLRALPFDHGFSGVRAQVVTLARMMSVRRKAHRQSKLSIEACIATKRLRARRVFLPTPPEVLEAVEHYRQSE